MIKFTPEQELEITKVLDSRLMWTIPLLIEGIERADLEKRLADCLGFDNPNSGPVSIARMNLVAGLRGGGFQVSGGRRGGTFYQIQGWAPLPVKVESKLWEGEPARILGLVDTLTEFTPEWMTWVRHSLSSRADLVHKNSPLYIYAYEGPSSSLYLYNEGGLRAVLVKKNFVTRPQFKILYLSGSLKEALRLAEFLAPASVKPVSILNVPSELYGELEALHHGIKWDYRREVLYDIRHIAFDWKEVLNARAQSMYRARCRDTEFVFDPPIEDQLTVVKTWKRINEFRHRQLAITRDFRAIKASCPSKLVWGLYREGHPVGHHLFDTMASGPTTVCLMNEKCLNYSSFQGEPVPGGKPGLSDFNQIQTCLALAERGFTHINSGGLDGGGPGLILKKKKYASSIITVRMFTTTFPVSPYA